jgi:hypothetical protein
MQKLFFAKIIKCLLVMCLALSLAGGISSRASASEKRALLIGINDYAAESIPDLYGAVNDIEAMRQVLITRYGFSDENITMISDEAATRDGILAALDQLVHASGKDDLIYIHYSGHGSQVEDKNGDEKDDNMDETIVPQDSRTSDEARDITDDELAQVLARLESRYTLIVLDSCHSGTATRDVVLRTRSIPADKRVSLYPSMGSRSIVPVIGERHVLMTGAASHENALDGPIDENSHYGLFTYALATTLSSAPLEASPEDIFNGISNVFRRLQTRFGGIRMPDPQLEAPRALFEIPLFMQSGPAGDTPNDEMSSSERAFLDVEYLSDGRVNLANAVHMNAKIGSYWAVYPPGEINFLPGQFIAKAVVEDVKGSDAIAKLSPADITLVKGCRAVAIAAATSINMIRVRLGKISDDKRNRLQDALSNIMAQVQFVGADEYAQFIVDVEDGSCNIYGLGGLQLLESIPMTSEDEVASHIATVFVRSQRASSLVSLHNPASKITIEVRAVLPEESAARSFQAVASGDLQSYRFKKANEPRTAENSLMLEIESNMDSYLTIVDVDTEGGINVLFPNSQQKVDFCPDGFIKGGSTIRIPDRLTGGSAGFAWDCRPPAGVETIQVFACTDLVTAETFRQYIAQLEGVVRGRSVSSRGFKESDLFSDLTSKLANRWGTRAFAVVPADEPQADTGESTSQAFADWNCASITVLVEE